jgi:hypothetical protein
MLDVVTFGSLIAVPQPGSEHWSELMARQITLCVEAVRAPARRAPEP